MQTTFDLEAALARYIDKHRNHEVTTDDILSVKILQEENGVALWGLSISHHQRSKGLAGIGFGVIEGWMQRALDRLFVLYVAQFRNNRYSWAQVVDLITKLSDVTSDADRYPSITRQGLYKRFSNEVDRQLEPLNAMTPQERWEEYAQDVVNLVGSEIGLVLASNLQQANIPLGLDPTRLTGIGSDLIEELAEIEDRTDDWWRATIELPNEFFYSGAYLYTKEKWLEGDVYGPEDGTPERHDLNFRKEAYDHFVASRSATLAPLRKS